MRDQLRQSDGRQQASGDAARKGRAGARDDRQPGPQRIARGGVRVVVKRVEKQVGEAVSGEVIIRRHAWREDKSLGRYAAAFGFTSQVAWRVGVAFKQPQ